MYTHEKKSWSTEGTSNLEDWGYASPENLQFYVISMEFLSLSCRRSIWWNVASDEEQGETAVFTG